MEPLEKLRKACSYGTKRVLGRPSWSRWDPSTHWAHIFTWPWPSSVHYDVYDVWYPTHFAAGYSKPIPYWTSSRRPTPDRSPRSPAEATSPRSSPQWSSPCSDSSLSSCVFPSSPRMAIWAVAVERCTFADSSFLISGFCCYQSKTYSYFWNSIYRRTNSGSCKVALELVLRISGSFCPYSLSFCLPRVLGPYWKCVLAGFSGKLKNMLLSLPLISAAVFQSSSYCIR